MLLNILTYDLANVSLPFNNDSCIDRLSISKSIFADDFDSIESTINDNFPSKESTIYFNF